MRAITNSSSANITPLIIATSTDFYNDSSMQEARYNTQAQTPKRN